MQTTTLGWRSIATPMVGGLLIGAGAGVVILGVGGRIAMRAIAIANNTTPGFTIGGTTTVLFLGLLSGIGGGVLYALLHHFVPRPRLLRSALYVVAIVLLTLRGLRPIQPFALEWFMPLALGYGVVVDLSFSRWLRRPIAPAPGDAAGQ